VNEANAQQKKPPGEGNSEQSSTGFKDGAGDKRRGGNLSYSSVGYYSFILSEFIDPGFMSVRVYDKDFKTIGPPGKQEGNATHKMCCAVSPEIALMGGCKTQVFTA
jgi:hypothetical protein